jgi:hypothetical protein
VTPGIAAPPSSDAGNQNREEHLVSRLGNLLRHHHLYREPLFAGLRPVDNDVESLIHAGLGGRHLEANEQLWLNRHLLEAAFRQATGLSCFRRLNSGLDCVLVSDVGKPMEAKLTGRAGGMIRTAMRSTDILMDRVWQLEIETFYDTPGYLFAPVTEIVESAEDPTALHPEIQRLAGQIRTDLDRFSSLEISTLVRHGYCVGRKACRSRPDVFGTDLPDNAPWDPIPGQREAESLAQAANAASSALPSLLTKKKGKPAAATVEARTLHASAIRRIWSTMFDYRDWVSFVYVPILVPIMVLLPYFAFKFYEQSQRSHRFNQIVKSLSQSNQDLEQMNRLLDGPISPWTGETPEEVQKFDEPDLAGFEVLQDMHIVDLRSWNPAPSATTDSSSMLYAYRRIKVMKTAENTVNQPFRIPLLATSPNTIVRFPPQKVPAKLRRSPHESSDSSQKEYRWEASYNLESVPVGDYIDLIVEDMAPGHFIRRDGNSTTLSFPVHAETAEMTRWFLLPKGKGYSSFRIIRYKIGKPGKVEDVKIVTEYLAEDYTILAFKLLSVDPGYLYEVTWYYK